jgi:hypothetical protein
MTTEKRAIKADWSKVAEALINFAQRNRRALARIGAQIRETANDDGIDLTDRGWKEAIVERLQGAMPKGALLDERLVNRCLTAHNQRQIANKLGIAQDWESARFDAEAVHLIKLKQAEISGDEDALAALKAGQGAQRGTKPINWIARTMSSAAKLTGEQLLAVIPEIAVKMTNEELTAAISELSGILADRRPKTETAQAAQAAVRAVSSNASMQAVG